MGGGFSWRSIVGVFSAVRNRFELCSNSSVNEFEQPELSPNPSVDEFGLCSNSSGTGSGCDFIRGSLVRALLGICSY